MFLNITCGNGGLTPSSLEHAVVNLTKPTQQMKDKMVLLPLASVLNALV